MEIVDKNGRTALMIAASYGRCMSKLRLLLPIANINIKGKSGNKALMLAIKNENIKEAMAILDRGDVNLTIVNKEGETALSLAIKGERKCREIVKILKAKEDES